MTKKDTNYSPAYQTFLASMKIGLNEWREGIGYDLAALEKVSDFERDELVQMLGERLKRTPNWREVEALGAIGAPAARAILLTFVNRVDRETRLQSAAYLAWIFSISSGISEWLDRRLRQRHCRAGFEVSDSLRPWNDRGHPTIRPACRAVEAVGIGAGVEQQFCQGGAAVSVCPRQRSFLFFSSLDDWNWFGDLVRRRHALPTTFQQLPR